MPFFIKGKRKRPQNGVVYDNVKQKKNKKIRDEDEEISSDSDEEVRVNHEYNQPSDEDVEETVQEKKLRLAKKYLEEISKEEQRRLDADEVDRDVISARLKDDILEQAGRLRKSIADSITGVGEMVHLRCNDHKRNITCLCLSSDSKTLFSASDDFSIVKWSLSERRKVQVIKRSDEKGHKKRILCLAVSSDQKFLVSGDASAKIFVWNVADLSYRHTFAGHRTDVTGLSFRKDTHQLFSCSSDKTVKIWNLDEMMYVETLYGHQCGVSSIDSLARDRAVTAGGRDNTLRIWKVVEESHLVLNGKAISPKESVDCVRLLDEDHVISGGDDGYVCLWSSLKKKPVCSLPAAHGDGAWVISIATCLYTDLFASGSHTGHIQIYKVDPGLKSFTRLIEVPIEGNVNALAFSSDGSALIAGIGREHRLGRWTSVPTAKNEIVVIPLLRT